MSSEPQLANRRRRLLTPASAASSSVAGLPSSSTLTATNPGASSSTARAGSQQQASGRSSQRPPARPKRRFSDAFNTNNEDASSTSSSDSSHSSSSESEQNNTNNETKQQFQFGESSDKAKTKITKRKPTCHHSKKLKHNDEASLSSSKSSKSVDDCCICMSTPLRWDLSKIDGCVHQYCFGCIAKWAETENTCPLCKKRFTQISRVYPVTSTHPSWPAAVAETRRSSSSSSTNEEGGTTARYDTTVNTLRVENRNQHRPLTRGAGSSGPVGWLEAVGVDDEDNNAVASAVGIALSLLHYMDGGESDEEAGMLSLQEELMRHLRRGDSESDVHSQRRAQASTSGAHPSGSHSRRSASATTTARRSQQSSSSSSHRRSAHSESSQERQSHRRSNVSRRSSSSRSTSRSVSARDNQSGSGSRFASSLANGVPTTTASSSRSTTTASSWSPHIAAAAAAAAASAQVNNFVLAHHQSEEQQRQAAAVSAVERNLPPLVASSIAAAASAASTTAGLPGILSYQYLSAPPIFPLGGFAPNEAFLSQYALMEGAHNRTATMLPSGIYHPGAPSMGIHEEASSSLFHSSFPQAGGLHGPSYFPAMAFPSHASSNAAFTPPMTTMATATATSSASAPFHIFPGSTGTGACPGLRSLMANHHQSPPPPPSSVMSSNPMMSQPSSFMTQVMNQPQPASISILNHSSSQSGIPPFGQAAPAPSQQQSATLPYNLFPSSRDGVYGNSMHYPNGSFM